MKRWTAKNWLYIAEMPYKRALGGKSLPFLKPSEEKMAMNSIIFIDDRVQDKQALFSTIDESTKWFVLDSSLDGINQMQRMLSSYRNLDSIQIISHGSTGAINIGSTLLNNTTLPYYQTQLQAIGSSLKETGDLLLYGCDVAKGDEGQKFITDLAKVTGADVAASNDLTGSTSLGGNLMNIHTEFDTAESNFGIDANNDGIIGALSSIELNASKATEEEIVPVICICWREEDLYQAETHYFDADFSGSDAAVEIAILGVQTHPTVAYSDFTAIA